MGFRRRHGGERAVRNVDSAVADSSDMLSRARLDESGSRYLLSLWDAESGGFRFSAGGPATLNATAYCVLGLEFTGDLSRLTRDQESAVTSFLTRGARPDGSFEDRLFDRSDLRDRQHDFAYLSEETTTLCQQALDALLAPAPPPRRWPDRLLRREGIRTCLASFPWENAWLDSNRVMFLLSQFCHDAERHRRPELLELVDAALDWLDERQSSRTGLWEGPHAVSLTNAMAATFHFTFFYNYRRRPLRYLERIIDSCLLLQRPHGLFGGSEVGHTCLDYDALDLLAKASLATDYRTSEVHTAMSRAGRALQSLHNPVDGGFAHCKSREKPVGPSYSRRLLAKLGRPGLLPLAYERATGTYNPGWPLHTVETSESNSFSTWFRLLALRLADQPAWIDDQVTGRPRFRRLPFLAYHDPLAVLASERITRSVPLTKALPAPSTPVSGGPGRDGLISVIIPAHNADRYLDTALSRLRSQTHTNWEAIIVDDGSTDLTDWLAQRWARAESRVRVLSQENRGLGAARNAALDVARGDWIHCLDADDLIEPEFYRMALEQISETSAGVAVGQCAVGAVRLLWGHGQITHTSTPPQPRELSAESLGRTNPRQPVCFLFERRILEQTGVFDESLRHCQDWDLWLRFARAGVQFVKADRAYAWYRLLPSSLSSRFGSYLEAGSTILDRATRSDLRCAFPNAAPVVDSAAAVAALVQLWLPNVFRATNKLDTAGVTEIFQWARGHLPAVVWVEPERFEAFPAFRWAYDCPKPRNGVAAALVRRGSFHVRSLAQEWPELGRSGIRRIQDVLVSEAVQSLSDPDERASFAARFGVAAEAGRMAIATGLPSGRVLPFCLWALLPCRLRAGSLRFARRLRYSLDAGGSDHQSTRTSGGARRRIPRELGD